MNILIIGSGAREHAIVWKLSMSPAVSSLWVAPGNPGTAKENKTQNVGIAATDISALLQFAQDKNINFTIVGPELPLSLGIVDAFQTKGLLCLGPTQAAAQLETSKVFAKALMQKYGIPSACYAEFSDAETAEAYVKNCTFPQVIKADGLASGKGVIIAQNFSEAKAAIHQLLSEKGEFSSLQANKKLIVEDFLEGFEVSFIILTDSKTIIPLATAQDNKRRNNGNLGPNTGGMGACSPAPHVDSVLEKKILDTIITPTLKAMEGENRPYQGFLFAGLMISPEGELKVLEFNCRLGDPETEAILMRLESDFATLCFHAVGNTLDKIFPLQWNPNPALSLILAAEQYPEDTVKCAPITSLPTQIPANAHIFHAGTQQKNEQLTAHGGRIFCISALGQTLIQARELAYALAKDIYWEGGIHYRTDIGENNISKG